MVNASSMLAVSWTKIELKVEGAEGLLLASLISSVLVHVQQSQVWWSLLVLTCLT